MTKTIIKRIYAELFKAIINGSKTFDMQLAEINYQLGGTIRFVEIGTDRSFYGQTLMKKVNLRMDLGILYCYLLFIMKLQRKMVSW